ncbi:hypothetical protein B0H19DRAFT_1277622 [Mycena capillaripes]|nr:hypothetical protein B0H19DRAFT_1277622 [Mycena capillaripes]
MPVGTDKGVKGAHRRTTLSEPRTLLALSQIMTMHAKARPDAHAVVAHPTRGGSPVLQFTGSASHTVLDPKNEWEDTLMEHIRGTCAERHCPLCDTNKAEESLRRMSNRTTPGGCRMQFTYGMSDAIPPEACCLLAA